MNRIAAAVLLATLLALSAAIVDPIASGGQSPSARLDLVDQTIFVGEDDVQIVLRVSGAPDTAELRLTICQPRTTREAVRAAHDEVSSIFRAENDGVGHEHGSRDGGHA